MSGSRLCCVSSSRPPFQRLPLVAGISDKARDCDVLSRADLRGLQCSRSALLRHDAHLNDGLLAIRPLPDRWWIDFGDFAKAIGCGVVRAGDEGPGDLDRVPAGDDAKAACL